MPPEIGSPAPPAPATAPPKYVARVLPLEEWQARVNELPYPPGTLDPGEYKVLLIVEETATGKIVGSWGAVNLVALEGLHLDPAHQHSVAAKHLLYGMLDTLLQMGTPGAVTFIEDPSVMKLAEHAGFVKLPASVYQINLQERG